MARYEPVIHATARRELDDLDDATADALTDAIVAVAERRQPSDHPKVKPLEGQPGLLRVRSGDVRAILELKKPELRVLRVGHRETVYDCVDDEVAKRRVSG